EIADDLPVTGHRLSRTVRDTDVARSMVEVFAVARFCAMELITKKIARSLRKHRELILNYFRAQKLLSSGVVEGLNNKAKVTMRKSYGFRTYRVLELALYHSLGKLPEPESTHDFF
ncbi:MAG: transposase, partial [Acidobacteriaceae bacterium]|nr:transposase [Acidobacteriaceae bacterium]